MTSVLARELRPALITLDVMMPSMDGWSVRTALKSDPAIRTIPVVMISIVDDKQLGFALGAADYLTKPIDRTRLTEILQRHVSREQSRNALVIDDLPAENGREGLACFEQARPALILLDLMMGDGRFSNSCARCHVSIRSRWIAVNSTCNPPPPIPSLRHLALLARVPATAQRMQMHSKPAELTWLHGPGNRRRPRTSKFPLPTPTHWRNCMSETQTLPAGAPPAHAQLVQMATAYWVSRVVHAATELGLADHLSAGPQTADVLAGLTQTKPAPLYRLLRTAASLGLFTEDASHRFALTPLGEAMKRGAPGAARASILTLGGRAVSSAWENLRYSLQTGKPGFDKANGAPIFDWLTAHPEEASLFGETMIGFHGAEPAAVAAAYDFSGFQTLADVGGGTGNLLTTILAAQPGPRGVLFDLPHVVKEAAPLIQQRGLTDRVETKSGSFFETVPAGGDAYLLSHIIHDWNEEQCLTILGHCRNAMKPASRLLLIEMVLPDGNTPHPGKMLDMMMLVGPGGQERTADEYRTLLEKAGLRLTRVIPTASAVSIVEATKA